VRIGYLSGELREHATSHLLVGVIELHDSSRFEVYGFDNGWNDQSNMRRRIETALHRVIDISKLSDPSAVAAIYENQIDILVNLNGYFGRSRTGVFAKRPAPVQVNYLGFPGTIGAKYIDYIIADRCVIPEPQRALPDHLARHRLGGLFLDTLPYDAHTTASDALWAGLPVLTCLGKTFAGRVCASLLNAVNLPDTRRHDDRGLRAHCGRACKESRETDGNKAKAE